MLGTRGIHEGNVKCIANFGP